MNNYDGMAVGAGLGARYSRRRFLRAAAVGVLVTVANVLQLEEEAAGWGPGVGLTPWCQVEVP